jgi:RNA polymerase sigma factor (sigma-70 family)
MDDLGFVQRCVNGDKQAWEEFVDRYSRLIYTYINNVLKTNSSNFPRDNKDDIFQDIFVLLRKDNFAKLGSFRGKNGCSLATWLRQVVINFTIDYLRRTKLHISIDQQDDVGFSLKEIISAPGPDAADILVSDERILQLRDCVQQLNNDDKYFVELHINQRLPLEALVGILGISRGAVDMRKVRITGRLQDCFKAKGFMLD